MADSDDYERGLARLWGEETLKQLREFVKRGDIEEPNISNMSARMGVKRIYNENCHKFNLVETFDRMLEGWFNETLFHLQPREATDDLLRIIEASNCTKRIASRLKTLSDSFLQDLSKVN